VTPTGLRPPEGPGPSLVRVGEDEELLEVAKDVTVRGFEAPPELLEALFATKLRADGLDLWLAYVDGEPVSTALGQTIGDAVGIFNVATPPEHRRKGYGTWATAQAVRAGFEAGAAFAYLQSSETGFGIYRALGFEQVCEYRLFAAEGEHAGGL
jgi:ribosomal protein S18 acetylase RimI-like enzyme